MKTTKKRTSPKTDLSDDLRPHYDFDYSKAKPNRFAKNLEQHTVVVLDSEVSKVFQTEKQVNHALHALIKAMPAKKG
jgi:hypothetical protein